MPETVRTRTGNDGVFYDMIFLDCHKDVPIQQVQENIIDLFRNNYLDI